MMVLLLAGGAFLGSCQQYRNFTTYYNRFWNMERIMAEVEDDVDYYRDTAVGPQPRYVVPFDEVGGEFSSTYLDKRILTPDEVRKHRIKLDSILLKGSILLTHQAESDYVDDAIFYIAKTYFYQREWFQSSQKTRELIENFPDSKWQPDAHLLLAMDLLMQGEIAEAEDMLSKTVDVAFRYRRQDVLTEAFRLNADVQLSQGETDLALRPYERAILLSESDEEKARWQYGLGVVLFRAGEFDRAVDAFDLVDEYDPDPLTAFEADLQGAVALRAAGRNDEAADRLATMADEEDYEPWQGIVMVEKMNLELDATSRDGFESSALTSVDSLGAKEYLIYAYYERGVRAFRAGDYALAEVNFARVQSSNNPLNTKARSYTVWTSYYQTELRKVHEATRLQIVPFPDSLGLAASRAYFNVARFFVRYDIADSAEFHYRQAHRWAPVGSQEGARATFALADFLLRKGEGVEADSLLTELAENYGDNEWAREARRRLGYTEDFVIDAARETYQAGLSMMQNAADYPGALRQFSTVVTDHAGSPYAPQALYASGLIFERYLERQDSALYYYARLLNTYPESEQARAIRPLVEATLAGNTAIDTSSADGLVPLAEADGEDGEEEAEGEVAVEEEIPWHDPRLYDPVPELALARRALRTQDLDAEAE